MFVDTIARFICTIPTHLRTSPAALRS